MNLKKTACIQLPVDKTMQNRSTIHFNYMLYDSSLLSNHL